MKFSYHHVLTFNFLIYHFRLNIYDFQRIQHGPNKGGYAHQHLIRGKPELCHAIIRVFVPTKRKRGGKQQQRGRAASRLPRLMQTNLDMIEEDKHDDRGPISPEDVAPPPAPYSIMSPELVPQEPTPITLPQATMAETGHGVFTPLSAIMEDDQAIRGESPHQVGSAPLISSSSSGGEERESMAVNKSLDVFAGKQFYYTNDPGSSNKMNLKVGSNSSLLGSRGGSEQFSLNGSSTTSSLQCTAADVEDFFKDLFQPSALEQDIPLLNENDADALQQPRFLGAPRQRIARTVEQPSSNQNAKFDLTSAADDGDDDDDAPNELIGSTTSYCPSSRADSTSSTEMWLLPGFDGSAAVEGATVSEDGSSSSSDVSDQGGPSRWNVSTNKSLINWPSLSPTQEEMLNLASHESIGTPTYSASNKTGSSRNEDLTRSEAVFPAKLHRMLEDAHKEGFNELVSWIRGGTAFKVHDVDGFMEHVMTKYFDQTKFQSFRRQLNLYQFIRVNSAVHGTYYFHKCFLQSDPNLCHKIVRPKTNRRSRRRC